MLPTYLPIEGTYGDYRKHLHLLKLRKVGSSHSGDRCSGPLEATGRSVTSDHGSQQLEYSAGLRSSARSTREPEALTRSAG